MKLLQDEIKLVFFHFEVGLFAAGLMARMMGLPVRFVCAVTSNDIVARMVKSGQCELLDVKPSLAPSIDMQVSFF